MGEGEPSIIMLCCEIPSLRAAPRLPGYSPARTSTRPAIPKSESPRVSRRPFGFRS